MWLEPRLIRGRQERGVVDWAILVDNSQFPTC
jgi:hypothetical protein